MRFVTFAGLAAVALAAGCTPIRIADLGMTYSSIESDLADAEGIDPVMPETGTATYEGVVGIGGNFEDGNVVLAGDAALEADFAAATLTGTLDNFVGASVNSGVTADEVLSDPLGNLFKFGKADGAIDVTGGVITDSAFTADFGGDVSLDGNDYTIAGTMDGNFRGANGELIEASADDFTMQLDGADATGSSLILVGRQ